LIYKSLVLTGLRLNELATLTVWQLRLDGRRAFAELDAADEKNREGNVVPIRDDLAANLREWLADRLGSLQAEARRRDEPIPSRLPAEARMFVVPKELVKILNRDLNLAGISKADDRGRTITYGRCAVAPLVALTDDKPAKSLTIGDKMGTMGMASGPIDSIAVSAQSANKKGTLTSAVNVPSRAGEEIRTPDVQLGKLAFYH
jgi:Phage integrase family